MVHVTYQNAGLKTSRFSFIERAALYPYNAISLYIPTLSPLNHHPSPFVSPAFNP